MAEMIVRSLTGSLADALAGPPAPGTRLFWLGQAGFAIEAAGHRLLIDPYLSDSLAVKYRGGRFPHERLMPPPVTPDRLGPLDLVLATHAHTDHMDPETLTPLFAARPALRLVAPAAAREAATARAGIADDRAILMDAGERIEILPGLVVTATPAAHETRERDAAARHRFLGYAIRADGRTLWHSGDCVPFDGLVPGVAPLRPDLALLPVNGRRPELSGNGIPGNFSLSEAIEVAAAIGARAMIAHHFGMFAFNTADPADIDAAAAAETRLTVLRARAECVYEFGPRET